MMMMMMKMVYCILRNKGCSFFDVKLLMWLLFFGGMCRCFLCKEDVGFLFFKIVVVVRCKLEVDKVVFFVYGVGYLFCLCVGVGVYYCVF